MPGVSEEQVRQAREIDLLSWLQSNEPDNLRRVGGEYCLRDHDSLKISNGRWHWHSRGIGGRSALDYLIKVRDMSFVTAVETLCDGRTVSVPAQPQSPSRPERQEFSLPPRSPGNYRMTAYLQSRGIGKALIDRCIKARVLYESTPYHNAVFVGRDQDGEPRFACARGTTGDFKRDVAGSDKRFGFTLPPLSQAGSGMLAVFESPIDALSHAELTGQDCHRLSLAGTANTALLHFLEEAHTSGHPAITHIALCLDNDAAGLTASAGIRHLLENDARFAHITVTHDQPRVGKDYNEALLAHQRGDKAREQGRQRDGDPYL